MCCAACFSDQEAGPLDLRAAAHTASNAERGCESGGAVRQRQEGGPAPGQVPPVGVTVAINPGAPWTGQAPLLPRNTQQNSKPN